MNFLNVRKIFDAGTTQQQLNEKSSEPLQAFMYLKSLLIFLFGGTGSGDLNTTIGIIEDMGLLHRLLLRLVTVAEDLEYQTTIKINY